MFKGLPFLALALMACAAVAADAGPPSPENPNWFPFTISALDGSPTAIDLSFLNEKPAGANGFLCAEGERIVDGQGRPMRLFGTNFCGGACFPDEADAVKVAAHLAKNGINVVRLHHMDNDWGESLIEDNAATELNAGNLAKLDRLIGEFIKRGIYINLNLHVSRTYPGTPKSAPRYSKGLDYFHPPFIAAFKSYARQLLEHTNPHTGRAYKDEPGVAVIEMNNENTLVLNPWWMTELPELFAGELRERFIKHLRARYPNTEKLRESWGVNDGGAGPNVIRNGDFAEGTQHWNIEAAAGAKAKFEPALNAKGIRWTSTQSGSLAWSLQFSQAGLSFDEKSGYRLSFQARSDQEATLGINASNAAEPWANLGLTEQVELTPEWRGYQFEFTPHSILRGGQNRIVFSLLNKVTSVELTDVKLQTVPTGFLKPEHTLEAGNIPLPVRSANLNVRRDFFAFLIDLEIEHALAMKKFLRKEVGAKQMITHSQVLFGGIVGARREFLVSDIVDTHGYWHHPHFPHKPWDMNDWEINNVSQVASPDGGTLAEMAMQRPVGKPYSVSEYDTPAPNDFAAETFPLLAAMACLQDWSTIYHFNFKHSLKYDSDKLTSFFDLPGHPAKQAFLPLAALVFRRGLIQPMDFECRLSLSGTQIFDFAAEKSGDLWGSWREVWGKRNVTGAQAWKSGVRFDLTKNSAEQIEVKPRTTTEGRQPVFPGMAFDKTTGLPSISSIHHNAQKGQLMGAFPGNAILLAGKLSALEASGKEGAITISPAADNPPGVLLLVPLDGTDLLASKKLWLCALSRAENQDMGWDKERRTVGAKWGSGPALVLGVKAKITLPGDAAWKVETLDPTGSPKAVIAEKTREFEIGPEHKTVWWLMTR